MGIIDVAIHEAGSGGDYSLVNDDMETVSGFFNMVYLGLFGGNIEQVTSPDINPNDQRFDWWANEAFNLEFNSTFENKIRTTPLTSSGIIDLENAAKQDLKFMEEFAEMEITGSIVGIKKFQLDISLSEPDNQSSKIKFIWDGNRNELIEQQYVK